MKEFARKGCRIVALLLLCCVTCVVMPGINASAACNHGSKRLEMVYVGRQYNETSCWPAYDRYTICNSCGFKQYVGRVEGKVENHALGSTVTCDGKMQTRRTTCSKCNYTKRTTSSCPAGPHANGQCPALPLSVKPEIM